VRVTYICQCVLKLVHTGNGNKHCPPQYCGTLQSPVPIIVCKINLLYRCATVTLNLTYLPVHFSFCFQLVSQSKSQDKVQQLNLTQVIVT